MRLALISIMLLLAAAHAPRGAGRHAMPSMWHFGAHDGMSRRDFGRNLRGSQSEGSAREGYAARADRPFNLGEIAVATGNVRFGRAAAGPNRLDIIPLGHSGAQVHVGFIQGHHPGFRIGIPF